MDRLIAANSVPMAQADTAPTTGTPQGATDGNPASNLPATRWPSYQYNAIQEELMAIIEAAEIAPDRTNNAQVLAALKSIFTQQTQIKSQHLVGSTATTNCSVTFSFTPPANGKLLISAQGGAAGTTSRTTIALSGFSANSQMNNCAADGTLSIFSADGAVVAGTEYSVTLTQTAGAGVVTNNLAAEFVYLPD